MGMVKTAHSGIPMKHLRGSFSQLSARGDTTILHLGEGHDRVFVHAWNEPGWKNGKEPQKPAKVFIANCFLGCTGSGMEKGADSFATKWHGGTTISRRSSNSSYSGVLPDSKWCGSINIAKVFWPWSAHGNPRAGIYDYFKR